jgi:phosphoglycerate dehydrogenase-like enzyme
VRVLFRGQVFRDQLRDVVLRRSLDFIEAHDDEMLLRELPSADALWITPSGYRGTIAPSIAARRGNLRWVALTSAGYDVFLRLGAPAGVQLTCAAGVHSPAVAEHAVALLLGVVRQLPAAVHRQHERAWDPSLLARLRSLEDMTVTVVGFGSIGGEVARRLRPLAHRVLGVTRAGDPNALADEIFPFTRLEDALRQSDAVIVAVALNDETRGLFDARRLAMLPPNAVLVNVSRGSVIDTGALIAALEGGTLGAAALDVTDPEPLPPEHPLWTTRGVTITPHMGSFGSIGVGTRLAAQFERNLDRFERREPLEGRVVLPEV